MLGRPDEVTPALLRDWPLPEAGNSKYDRGRILVVGGAAQTPGAVQLAGLAALRVGAGSSHHGGGGLGGDCSGGGRAGSRSGRIARERQRRCAGQRPRSYRR